MPSVPTKSCELASTSERIKKYLNANNNLDNQRKIKY